MQRKGWTRLRGGCAGVWQHTSGWLVRHCGHPTALWPYYGISPSGEMFLAPNGHGFRRLALAQKAVEMSVAGAKEA